MSWFFWMLIGLGIFILLIMIGLVVFVVFFYNKALKYLSPSDWLVFLGEEGLGLPLDELGIGELLQAYGAYSAVEKGEKKKKLSKS